MTPKQRYAEAHRKYQEIKYPASVSSFGHLKPNYPDTRKANGLTLFITNFLNWSGHRATRISSAGRVIKSPQKQPSGISLMTAKYIPGPTRKGTADISATINGRAVMLEIKIGSDRPSEHQLTEQWREREAGGVYEFLHTPEEFFLLYDKLINLA